MFPSIPAKANGPNTPFRIYRKFSPSLTIASLSKFDKSVISAHDPRPMSNLTQGNHRKPWPDVIRLSSRISTEISPKVIELWKFVPLYRKFAGASLLSIIELRVSPPGMVLHSGICQI